MKYCKFCGSQIEDECVVCPKCGKQVEALQGTSTPAPNIIITNTNSNTNTLNGGMLGKPKSKWTAFFLCLFLGIFGAHKFYEGKTLLGIVYLCSGGLFFIGVFLDLISLFFKPNPYYV